MSVKAVWEKVKNHYLKAYYIKKRLPAVYEKYCHLPVEEKVIILQQRSGLNSSCKYMYEKLVEDGRYQVVFHELGLHKKSVTMEQYFKNAEAFVKDFATCRAVITHEQCELIGYIKIRPETGFIHLWHGLPIKKVRLSLADSKGYKSMKNFREYPESNCTLVTLCADLWRPVYEELMGLEKDTPLLQTLGSPRTDVFFQQKYIDNCYETLRRKIPGSEGKKIILYAPTYRGIEPNRVAPDALDFQKLYDGLHEDYILIIKHHQTLRTWPKCPDTIPEGFCYDFSKDKDLDINALLTVTDILITDYSSLVFDYAFFARPILFFTFDEELYGDERGFYYTIPQLDAGPMVKTNEEIVEYIRNLDKTFDKQKVIDFKNRFEYACDGHSADRIIAYIDSLRK